MKKILLAGETFTVRQIATSGATSFTSGSYSNGALQFIAAFAGSEISIDQLPSERCEREFPMRIDQLLAYDAVILSDVSALNLLYTTESRAGQPSVNRLSLLVEYVKQGGSLMMAGGYTSFQGMDASARFHDTPLEDCLPVSCLPYADGVEIPEGIVANPVLSQHRLLDGIISPFPPIIGFNKTILRDNSDTELVAAIDYRGKSYPLLATRRFEKGRTLVWTTDIGPHWLSIEFFKSPVYAKLMQNILGWLTERT
jgi:uncharacterized membrane protein